MYVELKYEEKKYIFNVIFFGFFAIFFFWVSIFRNVEEEKIKLFGFLLDFLDFVDFVPLKLCTEIVIFGKISSSRFSTETKANYFKILIGFG